MQWIINNKATLKETEEMFWPVQNAAEFYWIFPPSGEDGREIDERRVTAARGGSEHTREKPEANEASHRL